MVKKARETKYDPKKSGGEFVGYVKHNLSRDEKKDYLEWVEDKSPEYLWERLEELVDSYYKFSCKEDSYGGGVMCSLTCANKTSQDCGLVLTARAPDLYNAALLLLYKHIVLLSGEWFIFHQENAKIDAWG